MAVVARKAFLKPMIAVLVAQYPHSQVSPLWRIRGHKPADAKPGAGNNSSFVLNFNMRGCRMVLLSNTHAI